MSCNQDALYSSVLCNLANSRDTCSESVFLVVLFAKALPGHLLKHSLSTIIVVLSQAWQWPTEDCGAIPSAAFVFCFFFNFSPYLLPSVLYLMWHHFLFISGLTVAEWTHAVAGTIATDIYGNATWTVRKFWRILGCVHSLKSLPYFIATLRVKLDAENLSSFPRARLFLRTKLVYQ